MRRFTCLFVVFLLTFVVGKIADAQTYDIGFYKWWSQSASAEYQLTETSSDESIRSDGDVSADFAGTVLDGFYVALDFDSFRFWFSFAGDGAGGVWTSGFGWNEQVFGRAYGFGSAPVSGRYWYYGTEVVNTEPPVPVEPATTTTTVQ